MSKNKEITVIVSSRKDGEENKEFIDNLKDTCGTPAKVIYILNDGAMGLSELYGSMLSNPAVESEIVVFLHDDIEPLRKGWGKEVVRLFNKHK